MEVVFTLLAEWYERGSVLLTSNLPFSKWEGKTAPPVDIKMVEPSTLLRPSGCQSSFHLNRSLGAA
jgi:hypothetical protein